AHADEASLANARAVEQGEVADTDIRSNNRRYPSVRVHDNIVLQVASLTEFDDIEVCAHDDAEPDARLRADSHVADECGGRGDPRCWVDLGRCSAERNDIRHGGIVVPL